MDRYIGLDVHKQSSTFVVLGKTRRRLRTEVVETYGKSLIEFLRLIPGNRHLCFEEGTQSQWLYEILSPHVHTIAIVPGKKRLGNKDDTIDAFELADGLRTGALRTKIYKAPKTFTVLREMTRTYTMINGDVVRNKNRVKSLYRSRGVPNPMNIFVPENRTRALKPLPPATRRASTYLFQAVDELETIKAEVQKVMVAEAHKHPIAKVLETAPGFGPVRVAQLVAVVVSPGRFRTSRKFWSYCGLAVVRRTSSDWARRNGKWVRAPIVRTRGLTRTYNHTLKSIFKGAATTIITQLHTDPLYKDFQRLLANGTDPNMAKLTITRKLAAIVLAMWKNKEVYNPAKYRDAQVR
jgi:transposase